MQFPRNVATRFVALILAGAVLGLAACAPAPSDVAAPQSELDRMGLDARRIALNGQISASPSDPSAGASGNPTFRDPNDITAMAEGAIAEAEGNATTGGGVFDNIQPQQASDLQPAPLIPRVATFALRTTHLPGQQQWRRNPFRRSGADLCTQFASRDLAQDRFLRDGGPERDPNGLDPDGDGFVCGFDPRQVRAEAAAPATSFDALPPIDG